MNENVCVALISAATTAIVSMIGWFVVFHQGKQLRKEEAQRDIYKRLFEMTSSVSNELTTFHVDTGNRIGELQQLFIKSNKNPGDKAPLDEWYKKVTGMINDTFRKTTLIGNYLRYLEMGGTIIGSETPIYQALKTVSIDTSNTLYSITGRWINYVNFENMNKIQLDHLTEETRKDLDCILEFCSCLDDVLIYLYNSYMSKPLKLKRREIDFTQNRRYVTEKGLVDKRLS